MKKALLFIFIIFLILIFLAAKTTNDRPNFIQIGECSFSVEIANTTVLKKKGLSNRNDLCDSCGMIFTFIPQGKPSFWMKDMNFPLDIIWLYEGKVLSINENISYNYEGFIDAPDYVDMVLEINSGKSKICKIKEGSILK